MLTLNKWVLILLIGIVSLGYNNSLVIQSREYRTKKLSSSDVQTDSEPVSVFAVMDDEFAVSTSDFFSVTEESMNSDEFSTESNMWNDDEVIEKNELTTGQISARSTTIEEDHQSKITVPVIEQVNENEYYRHEMHEDQIESEENDDD